MGSNRIVLAYIPLVMVALVASYVPSWAQQSPGTVIAVVDFSRILRDSLAGRDVRAQTDAQRTDYQAEIQQFQNELEKARQELKRQQTILSPEALNRKRKAYEQRARELQQTVQQRKQDLDQRFGQSMRVVEQEVAKILRELAAEKKINLIMNAARGGVVVFAEGELVITDEVINRLNQRLQAVPLPPPVEN